MDLLFKKSALPSIEDFAKDVAVKKNLTSELKRSIRIIQEENVGKTIVTEDEYSNGLCNVLEAIFIHGLKDKITRKMSSVFGSSAERIPEPQFWSAVSSYSHNNVLAEISQFRQITSDIGRGRAWLRCALNDGLIVSYVGNMLSDNSSLPKHYNTNAYIRDEEQCDIMKQLLEGLSVFTFQLSCNNSSLNIWNTLPLTLANVWTPPATPQPVMPAVDVIDFFTDPKNQEKNLPKRDSPRVKKSSASDSNPSKIINSEHDSEVKANLSPGTNDTPSNHCIESENDEKICVTEQMTVKERNESHNNDTCDIIIDERNMQSDARNSEETISKISSSDSVPDFGIEIIEHFPDSTQPDSMGNKLSENSGWSSTFECDQESLKDDADQSYDSLLQSYNKNLTGTVIGTPELSDTFSSVMQKLDEDIDEPSSETKSPESEFEIVPRFYCPEQADEETKKLLANIGKLCPEQGLDAQNFQCNSCGRPVGFIYGKARLCHYDGYNYCYECHENDEEFIPARMVHNWDFKQYPVSKRAKAFLSRVVKDPLLDIKLLNPVIYTAVEEMAQMQLLRTQLTFMRSYIFTCKQSVAEDLRMRLWPREYLYEHVHLYSIDDILEIPPGTLAQTIQKVIVFAKKHIVGCQLCLLKGFICEVCNNPKAIYPFDVESTYHCDKCLSVYHATCMDANKYCPKCVRRMKRQQLLESIPD